MSNVWLVARRELVTRGRSRSFLVGLAVSALLVAGLAVLPGAFGDDNSYAVAVSGAGAEQLRAALSAQADSAGIELAVTPVADRGAARAAVVDGEVDAALVDQDTVLYGEQLDTELAGLLEQAHRTVRSEQQLRAAGLDPQLVSRALSVPPLQQVSVNEDADDAAARQALAVVVVVLMLMLIYLPAIYVATGVVEEKSSRVVELLLAAVRPWQLLAGKIIGIGLLGLAQLVVVVAVGLGVASATGALPDLPEGTFTVVAGTFVWFLLGYAFFSAMAAASGSLVSRQEEINSVMAPMTLLLMASYFVGFYAIFNPGATLARVLSVMPPFSAIVMPVRTASTSVPGWELATAVALMALATAAVVAAGATIYRRAVLRTGTRVRLREAMAARSGA